MTPHQVQAASGCFISTHSGGGLGEQPTYTPALKCQGPACPDLIPVSAVPSLFLSCYFSPGQKNCLKCHPSCKKCVDEPERCTVCKEGFR